ncbi:MAG TPA: hypothetical protein EYG51_22145 [Pseudomonadales bacterium]|nr:hypothetical protein [Pseudomonadales bacterium]
MTIGIYSDSTDIQPAVWLEGAVKIGRLLSKNSVDACYVSRAELNDASFGLDDFSTLIFGGGYAYPGYTKHITQEGKKRLRDFVSHGGTYIGICAGAYFAGSRVVYAGIDVTETAGYDLGLFSGTVSGPAYKSHPDFKWKRTQISFGDDRASVRYAAAPRFAEPGDENKVESIQWIAQYNDGTPAIIEQGYGSGKVILWGPHPEIGRSKKVLDIFMDQILK